MPRLHAVFSSGFPHALKKKTATTKKQKFPSGREKCAAGDGNPSILAYFSKKARPLPDAGE